MTIGPKMMDPNYLPPTNFLSDIWGIAMTFDKHTHGAQRMNTDDFSDAHEQL